MSVTALVGDYALFHCNGTGSARVIIWVVDGYTLEHPTIKQRGITAVTISPSSCRHSTVHTSNIRTIVLLYDVLSVHLSLVYQQLSVTTQA